MNRSGSRLLMPLSFITILGGMTTPQRTPLAQWMTRFLPSWGGINAGSKAESGIRVDPTI